MNDLLLKFYNSIKNNLPLFSEKCVKIVNNGGDLVNFKLNPQQEIVHLKIEEQIKSTGKARVIILKSRKLGMSTYVASRFIHKTILGITKRAAVITHVSDSSNAIFRVYKRMYEHLPQVIRPKSKKNNIRELEFDDSDSSIKVATAGSGETGRGDTVHYLHCSEIGFWPNATEIAAGLMRSVADVAGTEIIIESTASGIDTLFYKMWTDAENGLNGYLPIFLPWTIDPHCSSNVPENHIFTEEELKYKQLYDLTDEQLYWRSITLRQLGEKKFKNEYPISAEEAFTSVDTDSFIPKDIITNARIKELPKSAYEQMPLILGIDVAALGADKSCIVWRRGDCITQYKLLSKLRNEELADEIIKVIKSDKPKKIFIDGTGGYGAGVASILRMRGHGSIVDEINFGSRSSDTEVANKRAEIFKNLKVWLSREVSIPNDTKIEIDLLSIGYKHNMNGQLQLEAKSDIKKRLGKSPDIADAMALTFAYGTDDDFIEINADWNLLRNREPDYAW